MRLTAVPVCSKDRFILRNMPWRDNPLIPRLQLLTQRSSHRRFRVNSSRCELLSAYENALCILAVCFQSIRPSYFNYSRKELTLPISLDLDFGRVIREAFNLALLLLLYVCCVAYVG